MNSLLRQVQKAESYQGVLSASEEAWPYGDHQASPEAAQKPQRQRPEMAADEMEARGQPLEQIRRERQRACHPYNQQTPSVRTRVTQEQANTIIPNNHGKDKQVNRPLQINRDSKRGKPRAP